MILPNGATVAVVDGKDLLLFRNRGHEPTVDLVALPKPGLGSGNAGSGTRHRSSTANPDAGRLEEDNYAAAASNYLNQAILTGKIEQLLIIADARTLGEIRQHFHQVLVDKLVGQLTKDLVGHSKADIEATIQNA